MIKPRRMKLAGQVAGIGQEKEEYLYVIGWKQGRKRPLGRP
jgi:hypothetical protein